MCADCLSLWRASGVAPFVVHKESVALRGVPSVSSLPVAESRAFNQACSGFSSDFMLAVPRAAVDRREETLAGAAVAPPPLFVQPTPTFAALAPAALAFNACAAAAPRAWRRAPR